jgi:16S rRNA (guanine(966)-N(2))-methyltransferase RsmD
VRESLFAWLGDREGARVLDLCAGTGALGIEALSRGAASVVFVERSARVCTSLKGNLEGLGLAARARVRRGDAIRTLQRLGREGARFDLVLVDPPYATGESSGILEALGQADVLAEDAEVVVEYARRHPFCEVPGLATLEERRYGDTVIARLAAVRTGGSRSE